MTANNDSGGNGPLDGAGKTGSEPTSGSDTFSGGASVRSPRPYMLKDSSGLEEFLATNSIVRRLQLLFGDRPLLRPPYSKGSILRAIDREIAEIDALINEQVNAVIHHRRFQALEAAWRGVAYLVEQADDDETVEIRVLDISWPEVSRDLERAIDLFEGALELKPGHEDSLYYLGNCLAGTGDVEGALGRFSQIMQANAQSQRAHKRWGTLRAVTARDTSDLDAAIEALERAASINPEETGVPLVLGEVLLIRGDPPAARQRLEWVVRSNPQAGEAYWVLAYLAWREGDSSETSRLLGLARDARSEDWKPAGVVAEGEVRVKAHVESAPFEDLYEAWDGTPTPQAAFTQLAARLE